MKKWILAALLLTVVSGAGVFAAEVININTAGVEELSQLRNIGPAKAAAIVSHRDANGPFHSVQELAKVSGIGDRTVEMNLDRIRFE